MAQAARLTRFNDRIFDALYSRSLIYNTCWEDPAVDRLALNLNSDDEVMVIASAGCNALDYALAGAKRVHAVDMNPRQIALVELKLAGIRALDFEDYFKIFGYGRHEQFEKLYRQCLRCQLSPFAQRYWDKHHDVFAVDAGKNGGLYFHGLSGKVARAFHWYLGCRPNLRASVGEILATTSIDEQREIYDNNISPLMWGDKMNWLLSRQLTMSMLGVPQAQTHEVQKQHVGGVAGFIREAIKYVFRQQALNLNYFWRLYLTGQYSNSCCPEYLTEQGFHRLKNGWHEKISLYTRSVTDFLHHTETKISKFVLLDHMDWMSSYRMQALCEEWDAIFARATNDARVIFRSAHAEPAYIKHITLNDGQGRAPLVERLRFHPELSRTLHPSDRVHTYAGFHIADIAA